MRKFCFPLQIMQFWANLILVHKRFRLFWAKYLQFLLQILVAIVHGMSGYKCYLILDMNYIFQNFHAFVCRPKFTHIIPTCARRYLALENHFFGVRPPYFGAGLVCHIANGRQCIFWCWKTGKRMPRTISVSQKIMSNLALSLATPKFGEQSVFPFCNTKKCVAARL